MKLHQARSEGRNLVTGYGAGHVVVNGTRFERSMIVLPDRVIEEWGPQANGSLDSDAVSRLTALGVDIVLIGTGERLDFPQPSVLRPLIEAGIGFEVMDTPAACRTYNILMGEERKVAAALIVG
jgi:uncharacterized protein